MRVNKRIFSYGACVLTVSLLAQAGALTTCCRFPPSSRNFVGEWQCGAESITVYKKGKALVAGKKAVWGHLSEDIISIEYKENGEPRSVELRAGRGEHTVVVFDGSKSEVRCEKKVADAT